MNPASHACVLAARAAHLPRDVNEPRGPPQCSITTSAIAADLNDRVIGHLFGCGLSLASVLGRHQLDDRITQQLSDVHRRTRHGGLRDP
jgi:hypothetical protein